MLQQLHKLAEEAEEDSISCDCDTCELMLMQRLQNEGKRQSFGAQSAWRRLSKKSRTWIPFLQKPKSSSDQNQYPWIQLAGHHGNFRPGRAGRVLKRLAQSEVDCLKNLMTDELLKDLVPTFYDIQTVDGVQFVEMQDLLFGLEAPSLMDCKIGCRTFLEAEITKAREDTNPRPDLFQRMHSAEPQELTADELEAKSVSKLRYMRWRESRSSTSTLSFRIDGIRHQTKDLPFDLRCLRQEKDVTEAVKFFLNSDCKLAADFLRKLIQIRDLLNRSQLFPYLELIGSSLLFAHDTNGSSNIWMIDFNKTRPITRPLTHTAEWIEGNREDGYLIGLESVIRVFQAIADSAQDD